MAVIRSAYVGYTKVFGVGENRFQPPVVDGLLALYNPAYEDGYSGTNIIYDLSGNGKDLTISGDTHSQNDDGSITFTTSSTAITSADLGTSLHGTSAEMTVVFMAKSLNSAYGGSGRWAIGPTSGWSGDNAVFEWGGDLSTTSGVFSIGTKPVTSGGGNYYTAHNEPYTGVYANKYKEPGEEAFSFAAYTKADQNASYTLPDTNVAFYMQGYFAKNDTVPSGQWFNSSLDKTLGMSNPNSAAPSSGNWINYTDDNVDNVLETDLAASRFYINGYVDLALVDDDYSNKEIEFGGAAIYDRVLSEAEITAVRDFYTDYYSF